MITKTQPSEASPLPLLYPNELLTTAQSAVILGLSVRTLAAWRSARRSELPYLKVGGRVRYRRQDVAAWLDNQTAKSSNA